MIETTNNCLFVNTKGELLQVFCAFKAIALQDVNTIKQGDEVYVTAVKSSEDGHIVFEIDGEYYFHHHFTALF